MWSASLGELETQAAYRRACLWLVALATVAAALLRLWNLGALGISVDEGFMALAVDGIVKRGVPVLDHGFPYVRALPFLYLQAAFAWIIGGVDGWSLRMPAALAGTACVPVAYLLGRKLLGQTVGVAAALLIAFSVWEIELSRYARFYTLFQMLWMISIMLFIDGFLRDRWPARLGFFAVVIAGLLVHDLMIFTGTMFLMVLPLRGFSSTRKVVYLLLIALFLPMRKLVNTISYDWPQRSLTTPAWLAEHTMVQSTSTKAITLPPFHLPGFDRLETAASGQVWLAAVLGVAAVIGLVGVGLQLKRGGSPWRAALLALAVLAAAADQVGLALMLLVADAALFVRRWSDVRQPGWIAAAAAIALAAAALIGWSISQGAGPRDAIAALFAFPMLDGYFVRWMLRGWPVMSAFFAVGLVLLMMRAGRDDRGNGPYVALAALLLPLVLAALVRSKWYEARYFFHLYPLVAMVFAMPIVLAAAWLGARMPTLRPAVLLLAAAAMLVLSQDANPLKAAAIAGRQYGQWRDPIKAFVSWPIHASYHQDHAGAAAYVREHRQSGDTILVVGPLHSTSVYKFYLGQVDYVFGSSDDYTRRTRDSQGWLIDDIANARIIEDLPTLKRFIEEQRRQPGTLWIISDTILSNPDHWVLNDYDGPDRDFLQKLTAHPVYVARDGRQTVIAIR